MTTDVEIGVVGGSGLYEFLDSAETVTVETPYGMPSAALTVAVLQNRRVAFLPRHGAKHTIPPHQINYRANLWALRSLGVRRIIGPGAVGSLQPRYKPGEVVICDQLVDRTHSRADTFFDGPKVAHVSLADPYCAELRPLAFAAAERAGFIAHDGGTAVTIQGPRFSTRAESRWFSGLGWEVVGMTQYPEVVLARELGLCYVNLSVVTDYDCGLEGQADIAPVTHEEVLRVFAQNVNRLRSALIELIGAMPRERLCSCAAGAPAPLD